MQLYVLKMSEIPYNLSFISLKSRIIRNEPPIVITKPN